MIVENLLDSDRSGRITIKPNQKRWWPRTIYHTYWSRISFWVQRNLVCSVFGLITLMSGLSWYFFMYSDSFTLSSYLVQMSFHDFYGDRAAHQIKLYNSPSHEYLLPDMKLDWRGVNSKLQVKAAFVSVVHENDLYALRVSMLDIEDRFNRLYGYPWIIISEKALSRKFRQWITSSTTAPVFFGQAPAIEWNEPYWVDIQLAEKNLRKLVKTTDTIDGESMNFRKMTRYNAGFLAYHPLLRPLEYYWRIHPGSRYTCDILQDPFEKMKREKKKFAFAAAITEDHNNLEGFQDQVIEFIQQNKDMIVPTNKSIYKALLNEATRNMPSNPSDPISEYQGHFSNCMIYNSFTIASLDFLRSKKYTKFFEALDLSGGFFYHKWGESMPQTVAAALLLEKFEIANDLLVGFEHKHLSICPSDFSSHVQARCTCTQFDYRTNNAKICTPLFDKILNKIA